MSDNLAQEVLDRTILNQLSGRCISQSWVYEPDLGIYIYRINWTYPYNYSLQRRKKEDQHDLDKSFWDTGLDVENWTKVSHDDIGFYPSFHEGNEIVYFDTSAKARVVIKNDILRNLNN